MYKSVGHYNYREGSLVIETDPELSRYYFSLLTKTLPGPFNKPMYAPHITIVRKGEYDFTYHGFGSMKGVIKNKAEIEFEYLPTIGNHGVYFFIPVVSREKLEMIRFEYGLNWCFDTEKGFHITIGNIK